MKKLISLLIVFVLAVSFSACSSAKGNAVSNTSASEKESQSEITTENKKDENILVAYFTWSGNTKEMAEYIAEQTSADLLEIKPSTPYPDDYEKTGDIAKDERDNNARPQIDNLPSSLEKYDKIFIGYPIWWHTAPMIIGTFLESYDLSKKEIYPFTQSSSMDTEQFQNSMDFVRKSAKDADVKDGLFVNANDKNGIDSYLKENNFI